MLSVNEKKHAWCSKCIRCNLLYLTKLDSSCEFTWRKNPCTLSFVHSLISTGRTRLDLLTKNKDIFKTGGTIHTDENTFTVRLFPVLNVTISAVWSIKHDGGNGQYQPTLTRNFMVHKEELLCCPLLLCSFLYTPFPSHPTEGRVRGIVPVCVLIITPSHFVPARESLLGQELHPPSRGTCLLCTKRLPGADLC